jgi:hypothetical protein
LIISRRFHYTWENSGGRERTGAGHGRGQDSSESRERNVVNGKIWSKDKKSYRHGRAPDAKTMRKDISG